MQCRNIWLRTALKGHAVSKEHMLKLSKLYNKQVTLKCEACGKNFKVALARAKKAKFCSLKCFGNYNSGTNNYNWNGGFSPYLAEFNRKLKEKIKERDGFICQHCGSDKLLAIHHIDYKKENNREDNLITLCKSCNLKANGNRLYWVEYYQEKMTGALING